MALFVFVFMAATLHSSFFIKVFIITCSPWVEREIWPFLKVAISPKSKKSHPPKLVCMYVTCVYTCMNFLSQFRSIKFFDDHGYSPWVEREIWLFLKVAVSPKSKKSHPPKLVCIHVS